MAGTKKSGNNLIDLESTTVDAVICQKNGENPTEEENVAKMKQRFKTLQLEVDLITKDDETEQFKSAVWSLGAGMYGTLVLDKMSQVDRNFLLTVVADYRELKKEQALKKWVKNSIKTTHQHIEKQAYQPRAGRKDHPVPPQRSGKASATGHEYFVKKYFGDVILTKE